MGHIEQNMNRYHGRCANSLYKWDTVNSPECDYGTDKQTVNHIAFECPIRSYQSHSELTVTTLITFIQ